MDIMTCESDKVTLSQRIVFAVISGKIGWLRKLLSERYTLDGPQVHASTINQLETYDPNIVNRLRSGGTNSLQ